jgi:predicted TIM-barrel fold metal-dependent hydrolase
MQASRPSTKAAKEFLFSADSHVIEPRDLWATQLPPGMREKVPPMTGGGPYLPGGQDPQQRTNEMKEDGVSTEVLYPTFGGRLFALDDAELQEASFRVYNDWLSDYCKVAPDRLLGVAMIPTYNIGHAIQELERCRKLELRGVQVWQAPHPDLPFSSDRYDPLWEAVQDAGMPVSLHIQTGHDYSKDRNRKGLEAYRASVNHKLSSVMDALLDLIFSGVLERFPRLEFVLVEHGIGWIPFVLEQWDIYYESPRFRDMNPLPIKMRPSEYFARQIFVTFSRELSAKAAVGPHNLPWWGIDNCMWANDFPHPESTWPHSRETIAHHLEHLSPDDLSKVLWKNVSQLYNFDMPEALSS